MNNDRYYKTSSFPLVSFLFSKGEQIAGINPTDTLTKKEFVFVQTDRLADLIWTYKFGENDDQELLVNARTYEQGRRQLLDKLND